jgi:hypothetical protein
MEFYDEILITLSNIKYKYINRNLNRSNVSGLLKTRQTARDKEMNNIRKIGIPCDSTIFGLVREMFTKKTDLIQSRQNKKYPELYQNIMELGLIILPEDFEYNQVCLNKNVECLPHFDGRNVGNSYIVSFGDFTGGELMIFDDDDNIEYIDIKYNPYCFNGAKVKHGTAPFEGTRYSLIYYRY